MDTEEGSLVMETTRGGADGCPDCGGPMVPVLDQSAPPTAGTPLVPDLPVHLHCPACAEARARATGD